MMMNKIRGLIAKYHYSQILLFGLLAFGIFMKPVLFSMGEMHELEHDPKAAISHVDLGESHEVNPENPSQDDRANANVMHTLTHFAHNCDQPTCTEAGCIASLSAALSRTHIANPGDPPRKAARPETLFRPPISI
jgi:hypothetical protein